MTLRVMRIVAVAFMLLGVLLLVTYVVSPLRVLWSWWYGSLPLPLQIGSAVAAVGLVILLTTMFVDRMMNRGYDKELKRS